MGGGSSDGNETKPLVAQKIWHPLMSVGVARRGTVAEYQSGMLIRRCKMPSFNSHGETYLQMTTDQELINKYGDLTKICVVLKHCMFDTAILETCIAINEHI